MSVSILLIGAGAVGTFYASRLAQAPNTQVSVVCRSNYKAVKANGFVIESPQYGKYGFVPRRVFASPNDAKSFAARYKYILVSTKALPDVSDDSALLEGLVSDGTTIVLIQNGLGIEEPYRKRFSQAMILSAVAVISVAQPSPGMIKHHGWTRISIGPYLPSGNYDRSDSGQRRDRLVTLFREGGIEDAEAYDHANLQLIRWHKIAINAALNPSSVLSGGTSSHSMSTDPVFREHLKHVMQEILTTVTKILDVSLPRNFASAETILESISRNQSHGRPSMWHDWASEKSMELEVILGNPIRIAQEHGFDMPRTQTLYALLKMAQANRDEAMLESDRSKL